MPVPKKRLGSSDQGHRRANWKAIQREFNFCPNCGSPKLAHTVCEVCGFYRGEIISPRFARKSGFDLSRGMISGNRQAIDASETELETEAPASSVAVAEASAETDAPEANAEAESVEGDKAEEQK